MAVKVSATLRHRIKETMKTNERFLNVFLLFSINPNTGEK